MLRLLVGALVVANALFYGWSQGWLDQLVGVRAQGDREPERLALQVEPQRVHVVGASARTPPSLPAPASAPAHSPDRAATCMEIGPFSPSQLAPALAALQATLPANRIDDIKLEKPAVWIIFMGPFPDEDARQKKVDELKRRRVAFEDIRQVPEIGDGLSLGRFGNRSAAEKALAELANRGVHTARVAQHAAAVLTHTLRMPEVAPDEQAQLAALQTPALAGKGLTNCTPY